MEAQKNHGGSQADYIWCLCTNNYEALGLQEPGLVLEQEVRSAYEALRSAFFCCTLQPPGLTLAHLCIIDERSVRLLNCRISVVTKSDKELPAGGTSQKDEEVIVLPEGVSHEYAVWLEEHGLPIDTEQWPLR